MIIGTGSELDQATDAAAALGAAGLPTRVVSMPCEEVFAQQPQSYRDTVLPPELTARVAIEAGATGTWWRWVGAGGRIVGIDRYGLSAPAAEVYEALGITAEAVEAAVREMVEA